MSFPDQPALPPFNRHPLYQTANRLEYPAHGQMFVFYEFSIGFVSNRLFREQFEAWFSSMGRYLAELDDTPETTRRLRDLAWHIWYRGRPASSAGRPHHRIGKDYFAELLPYENLLTENFRPLFEESTFWLAERLDYDRDMGHIWKVIVGPLHVARTLTALDQLITNDVSSPWRMVGRQQSSGPGEWCPDHPSRRAH